MKSAIELPQWVPDPEQWDFRTISKEESRLACCWEYLDATNGDYTLTWMMRGRHKPEFLRFTSTVRTYYLVPNGIEDEYPPQLAIVAIEGVSPFR